MTSPPLVTRPLAAAGPPGPPITTRYGTLAVLRLAPGQPLARPGRPAAPRARDGGPEAAWIVLTGTLLASEGRAGGEAAAQPLGAGDGVWAPAGTDPTTCAGPEGALVLGVTGNGALGPARAPRSPAPRPAAWRLGGPGDGAGAALDGLGGISGMGVRWLVTRETAGSDELVVATSAFAPGGRHELHRHPRADEFFLVTAGNGRQLTEHGSVALEAADLVVVPAGQWHGYCTDPHLTTRAVYGYLGAGSLDEAGYEVRA